MSWFSCREYFFPRIFRDSRVLPTYKSVFETGLQDRPLLLRGKCMAGGNIGLHDIRIVQESKDRPRVLSSPSLGPLHALLTGDIGPYNVVALLGYVGRILGLG